MLMSFSSSKESEYTTFVLPIASANKTNIEYLGYAQFLPQYEAWIMIIHLWLWKCKSAYRMLFGVTPFWLNTVSLSIKFFKCLSSNK